MSTIILYREDDRYRGYHKKKELPFRPGQRIQFMTGARLRSMHPNYLRRGWYEAARSQTISIAHLHPGSNLVLGYLRVKDGEETFTEATQLIDIAPLALSFGMEKAWDNYDATIAWLRPFCFERPRGGQSKAKSLVLPATSPTAVWSGTGGYWVECDVNDAILVPS